jgi:hypothetical protein
MKICKSNIFETDTRLVMLFIHKKKQHSLLIVFIMVVVSDVVVVIVLIVNVTSAKRKSTFCRYWSFRVFALHIEFWILSPVRLFLSYLLLKVQWIQIFPTIYESERSWNETCMKSSQTCSFRKQYHYREDKMPWNECIGKWPSLETNQHVWPNAPAI